MTLNLNLFPSEMMEDITHVDDEFNRIHRHLQQIINDTITDDVFNSMLHKNMLSSSSTLSTVLWTLFGLSLSALLLLCCWYCNTIRRSCSKRSVAEIKKQKLALLFARFALRLPRHQLPWPLKMRRRSSISPEPQPSQDRSGLSHSEGPKLQSFLNCLNI
jgi:hypothetical protein